MKGTIKSVMMLSSLACGLSLPYSSALSIEKGALTRNSVPVSPFSAGVCGEPKLRPPRPQTREDGAPSTMSVTLPGGVVLEMVYIAGGEFMMGEVGLRSAEPVHRVRIRPFWLGKYEVTNRQVRAVLNPKKGRKKGPFHWLSDSDELIDYPAGSGTYFHAVAVAEAVSRLTKRKFRLPSEAEWEFACRAGASSGAPEESSGIAGAANCSSSDAKDRRALRLPGTSGSMNQFGLHDMLGNLGEWVSDDAHDSYQGAPNDGSAWMGNRPKGPWNWNGIVRGGSYGWWAPSACGCTARRVFQLHGITASIGFRLAADEDR